MLLHSEYDHCHCSREYDLSFRKAVRMRTVLKLSGTLSCDKRAHYMLSFPSTLSVSLQRSVILSTYGVRNSFVSDEVHQPPKGGLSR